MRPGTVGSGLVWYILAGRVGYGGVRCGRVRLGAVDYGRLLHTQRREYESRKCCLEKRCSFKRY